MKLEVTEGFADLRQNYFLARRWILKIRIHRFVHFELSNDLGQLSFALRNTV